MLTLYYLCRLVADGVSGPSDGPFAVPRRIDVNRASIPELMALPGLGRHRATAVVLHRVRFGPFASLDELSLVDGLGPVTIARLRPFLRDPAR